MSDGNVTRGYGLLETWLANQRVKIANKLIPPAARYGRLLDIGCGAYPFFLAHTVFKEKFGVDQAVRNVNDESISLIPFDLCQKKTLPFMDNYFDVVTMLAVFEHLEPAELQDVLPEIRRVLKPGGLFVLTTPAKWTDKLLRMMSMLRLVSRDEIKDHKYAYKHAEIVFHLCRANFRESHISYGYFELFMNLWVTAAKEGQAI